MNQKSIKFLSEDYEQTEKKQECCEEVNIKVPFCCMVQVPHGFQLYPIARRKIAYNLDYLSVEKNLVEDEYGKDCAHDPNGRHRVIVCCSGGIYINIVLKCSIECLPHYKVNCHNVVVSDFTVTPVQDYGCNMLQFTGTIEFKHIPYE